ncbi:DUF2785 domain-containing protein [Lysobacter sp. S4-A87]|uniref:DUF2785 domain-containing protein n=1 Tax=Lysobacter sp. S4-A87 TaxID=2925843 RepID=UPI001F52CA04|nr:DUF2785 domain-containing protein [Lysobacter sp. S4-A87]UNK49287.1 DUF2785 domain-containing protein [Lysobacter sp. S4-A87]
MRGSDKRPGRAIVLLLALCMATPVFAAACPPGDWTVEKLDALKQSQFAVADAGERATLAMGLLECLGETDPQLRDGIAYEGLSAWMRKGELAPETLRPMRERLYAMLAEPDPDGVRWPFAALVLAEVARTDRTTPWMTPAERATMVVRAAAYFESVRDYRGFEADVGWRHGIAHGADWLGQLSLNPALDGPQLNRIVDAVAVQVVPASANAYVFGEPQRMAAPVLYAAQRGIRDEAAWSAWFKAFVPRIGEPALAWRDSAWLARRHDLNAFLEAVYVEADLSGDKRVKALLPGVAATLKALP